MKSWEIGENNRNKKTGDSHEWKLHKYIILYIYVVFPLWR